MVILAEGEHLHTHYVERVTQHEPCYFKIFYSTEQLNGISSVEWLIRSPSTQHWDMNTDTTWAVFTRDWIFLEPVQNWYG